MSEHFFEIVFENQDFTFDSRDEVEEPLEEALTEAGVGEVTGGGSGGGMSNIDVDANNFDAALTLIRQVLKELNVAVSTRINYFRESDEHREEYKVYE